MATAPFNALEHELKETKKALAAEKAAHGKTREAMIYWADMCCNEVEHAFRTTNLSYWHRRCAETKKERESIK